jgi:hypothetical protein
MPPIYVAVPAAIEPEEEGPPGQPALRDIPGVGWVLSKVGRAEVEPQKLEESFGAYVDLARGILDRAAAIGAGFAVDEVTFHLGIDAEVGLIFVGNVGVEAAIDIKVKRV